MIIEKCIYELAEQVGKKLSEQKLQLTTVESCTGGLLAGTITSVAGSSGYFERGFVTYSNEAKIELVGVSPLLLQQYGAVSGEVAKEMAVGGIHHSKAQVSVAITGIAGPDGGTATKPVGTVYFAWQILHKPITVVHKIFAGTRNEIRWQAVKLALQQLLQLL